VLKSLCYSKTHQTTTAMRILTFVFLSILILPELSGQYFGRNKPRYRSFDFKVKETPHFDVHYYAKNQDMIQGLSEDLELWYDYHSEALKHEIPFLNPIIFYNNHAEFQQTNAISGGIGVGTGGVTEGFKNRVIMPVSFSNQQTHQVLGHELVHAFQFNIIIGGDSTSIRSLSNVPLWIIEGMAEYMSIGRVDPFTAMWMRNAILNDDVPSLEKMANPRYFPYRYGQAAWSFLAGYFGDQTLKPFLQESAKYGVPIGAYQAFGTDLETLSNMWENGLKTHFDPFLGDKKESRIGKTLLSRENSGRLNVSPAVSPNGRWVVFMSEKDLFSTDIFLADARSGEIKKKLSSLVKDSDLDNFNFLESAGAWSPNSKQFAFVGFKKGGNVLVIKDVESGKTKETFSIKGVPAFTNPTWSPNGKEIIVTGSDEGQTDLYAVNVKSKRVTQLTDDKYSEIQAYFNSDGTKLAFSTDQRSFVEGRTLGKYTYDLAIMDYETREVEILDIFHGADNINATFDHEDNIYFMSDRDGYRNMYKYNVQKDEVYRMTDFLTGLSGISRYSPVLTAARKRDRVLFTHYYGQEYMVKGASSDKLLNELVDKHKVDFAAATLPVTGLDKPNIVNANLNNIDEYAVIPEDQIKQGKYKPKFELDYVGGGAGIGVTNSTFGSFTGLQGGVDLLFGDILGNHQLYSQLSLNGEIHDLGGQISYINRTNKVAWGAGISHIPLRIPTFGSSTLEDVDIGGGQTILSVVDRFNLFRIFDDRASLFAHLPFSTTLRLEAGANIGFRNFRQDQTQVFYEAIPIGNGQFTRGFLLGSDRERQEIGDEIAFNQFYTLREGLIGTANIALVGDNSHFGLTAPLDGYRYRVSLERSYGTESFYGILADFRKYYRLNPVTFAIRGMGYARFEETLNSVYPIFIGQMGFVRGYDFAFGANQNEVGGDLQLSQLFGSKVGLTSFEVRLPFTGPKQLSLIGSKALFTDLALFFDAGIAFDEFEELGSNFSGIKPELAMSVGASVRVNLFGALIIEPYWAYPLQENGRVVFGLNFIPGW